MKFPVVWGHQSLKGVPLVTSRKLAREENPSWRGLESKSSQFWIRWGLFLTALDMLFCSALDCCSRGSTSFSSASFSVWESHVPPNCVGPSEVAVARVGSEVEAQTLVSGVFAVKRHSCHFSQSWLSRWIERSMRMSKSLTRSLEASSFLDLYVSVHSGKQRWVPLGSSDTQQPGYRKQWHTLLY